ncbi:oocyte zinc finger protein XlCOF6-like [Centruroides vittatus]|uniref:oocyte zinc finger protein XlCOF6-like n=1 Tax=Centruroides vittatus TaxID=120091 RepID=UPI0035109322
MEKDSKGSKESLTKEQQASSSNITSEEEESDSNEEKVKSLEFSPELLEYLKCSEASTIRNMQLSRKSLPVPPPRISKRSFPWEQRLSQVYIKPEMLKKLEFEIASDEAIETIMIYQSPGISILRYKTSNGFFKNPAIVLPKPFSSSEMEEIKTKFNLNEVSAIPVHCGCCDRIFSDGESKFDEEMKEKTTFKCKICKEIFEEVSLYKKHFVLIHILDKDLFCFECTRGITSDEEEEDYDMTKRSSVDMTAFKGVNCQLCKKYLCPEDNLRRKLLNITLSNKSAYLKRCQFCENIGQHQPTAECQMMNFLTTTYVFCSECHSKDYDELYIKAVSTKKEPMNSVEELEALKCPRRKSEIILPVVCTECKRIFTDKQLNEDQVEAIPYYDQEGTRKYYYQCKVCNTKISDKSEMESHIIDHMSEDVICPTCRKRKQKR